MRVGVPSPCPSARSCRGPTGYYAYVIKPDNTVATAPGRDRRHAGRHRRHQPGLAAGEQGRRRRPIPADPRVARQDPTRPAAAGSGGGHRQDRLSGSAMNISETFIRRPIATSLMMLGLLVFGAATYNLLPVAALPNVDFPTITVSATLPGASPETMASSVATPLEQQFAAIPGLAVDELDERRSARPRSRCSSISAAASTAPRPTCRRRSMPPAACCRKDLPNPPTYRKVNPADRADPDLCRHLRRRCRSTRSTTTPTPSWRRRSRQ